LIAPVRVPLLENTIQVLSNYHRFYEWIHECCVQFNQTYTIKILGHPRYFIISTPENVEYVMKTNFWSFEKRPDIHDLLFDMLGEGIFTTDGYLNTITCIIDAAKMAAISNSQILFNFKGQLLDLLGNCNVNRQVTCMYDHRNQ
jgi:hypothetical protein